MHPTGCQASAQSFTFLMRSQVDYDDGAKLDAVFLFAHPRATSNSVTICGVAPGTQLTAVNATKKTRQRCLFRNQAVADFYLLCRILAILMKP